MATSRAWSGWISFAGLMIIIIGGLDFFEGLIAVIRDQYYVVTPSQIVVFDLTTWGWIMMIWGIILLLAGFGLLSGATWARWFTIVVASINVIAQLGFVGSAQYPLWALTVLALTIVVLYALIVRWDDALRAA
ncbi:MAG TPA: hypothetical protein VLD13_07770 [Gaiellaceae bacterium]|nr:hypothetical protein [Gaiellaceae bacterium]